MLYIHQSDLVRTCSAIGMTYGGQAWETSALWSEDGTKGDLQRRWDLKLLLFAQSPFIDLFFDLHWEFWKTMKAIHLFAISHKLSK
jgi:hypothetical protein